MEYQTRKWKTALILKPKEWTEVKLTRSLHLRKWGYWKRTAVSYILVIWKWIMHSSVLGKYVLNCIWFYQWHAIDLRFSVLWESSSIWHKSIQGWWYSVVHWNYVYKVNYWGRDMWDELGGELTMQLSSIPSFLSDLGKVLHPLFVWVSSLWHMENFAPEL